jgi:hypothetical protein
MENSGLEGRFEKMMEGLFNEAFHSISTTVRDYKDYAPSSQDYGIIRPLPVIH